MSIVNSTLQSMKIRTFRPEDIPFIVQRHADLYKKEYGLDAAFRCYVEEAVDAFTDEDDPQKGNIWIAEINGVPVGVIAIVKVSDGEAQLRWFLMEPEMRGKGIGNALLKTALDFCRENRYKKVFLWTISILAAARSLYKKHGFVLTETLEHEIWGNFLTEERWDLNLANGREQ